MVVVAPAVGMTLSHNPHYVARLCSNRASEIALHPHPYISDPGALFSSSNETSFTLQIRTVSIGGCKTDIHGIVHVAYDTASEKILRWRHYWDAVWDNRDLLGSCPQAR